MKFRRDSLMNHLDNQTKDKLLNPRALDKAVTIETADRAQLLSWLKVLEVPLKWWYPTFQLRKLMAREYARRTTLSRLMYSQWLSDIEE